MTSTITLNRKNVYGRVLVYPACETSRLLVKLTGQTTFSWPHIETLKALGFKVEYKDTVE